MKNIITFPSRFVDRKLPNKRIIGSIHWTRYAFVQTVRKIWNRIRRRGIRLMDACRWGGGFGGERQLITCNSAFQQRSCDIFKPLWKSGIMRTTQKRDEKILLGVIYDAFICRKIRRRRTTLGFFLFFVP